MSLITFFVAANRVDNLPSGIYKYSQTHRCLKTVRTGDVATATGKAALDQHIVRDATVVLILGIKKVVAFRKHGARGFRESFIEIGVASQRALLGAIALGYSARSVGAFYEISTAQLLDVNLRVESCLHYLVIGQEQH